MSRSRKHTPVTGVTGARSEKRDKVAAHRRERRRVRHVLHAEPAAEVLPHTRELSNPWAYDKDGKLYRGAAIAPRELRK